MSLATRESTLGKPLVRRFTEVTVRSITFRLRSLSAGEANEITCRHLAADDEDARASALASLPARYIVKCAVDEHGNCIYHDDDAAEILEQWDSAFTAELANACQKHCGATTSEGAEKNS